MWINKYSFTNRTVCLCTPIWRTLIGTIKFYTSPNCTNKICVWLFETPHGYWDDIWRTLIPIVQLYVDRLVDRLCKHWLYIFDAYTVWNALWMMVDYSSLLIYLCCRKSIYNWHYMVIDWASFQFWNRIFEENYLNKISE